MKAKLYIGIILVLLLSCSHLNAQDVAIVVNNYYDDYDYHFSSRINRFHKSYSAFDYYAPVYTDAYWYSYQPSAWGMSIYGGGLAVGYSESFPVYNYPVYNYYDPYFGSSFYYGYSPYYTSYLYTPVVINIGWRNDYGWNRHHHAHYYTSHRTVYNSYNNYNYYNNYNSSGRRYTSTRTSSTGTRNTSGNISRRTQFNGNASGTEAGRNTEQSNNGRHMGEIRRNPEPGNNRGQGGDGRGSSGRNQNINNRNNYNNSNNNPSNDKKDINSNRNVNQGQNTKSSQVNPQRSSPGRNSSISSGQRTQRAGSSAARSSSNSRAVSPAASGKSSSSKNESRSSGSKTSSGRKSDRH